MLFESLSPATIFIPHNFLELFSFLLAYQFYSSLLLLRDFKEKIYIRAIVVKTLSKPDFFYLLLTIYFELVQEVEWMIFWNPQHKS